VTLKFTDQAMLQNQLILWVQLINFSATYFILIMMKVKYKIVFLNFKNL